MAPSCPKTRTFPPFPIKFDRGKTTVFVSVSFAFQQRRKPYIFALSNLNANSQLCYFFYRECNRYNRKNETLRIMFGMEKLLLLFLKMFCIFQIKCTFSVVYCAGLEV